MRRLIVAETKESQNNQLIIFSALGIIILKVLLYDPINLLWLNNPTALDFTLAIIKTEIFQGISLSVILFGLIFLFVKHRIKIKKEKERIKIKKEKIESESYNVLKLLEEKIEHKDSDYLQEYIKELEDLELCHENKDYYKTKVRNKLILANDFLEKRLHEGRVRIIENDNEKIRRKIWKLREERFEEERRHNYKNKLILERLNAEDNYIYEKDKLRLEEIEANGSFAGFIHLELNNNPTYKHSAIIGFGLNPKSREKGIATKATRLITQYGFKKLKLKRISGMCRTFNKASVKVMEKAGYKLEGILIKNKFKDGKYLDDMVWAKVK